MSEADLIHALDLITTPPDAPQVQDFDPDTQEAIAKARSWVAGPNVVGSGAAPKITAGKRLDIFAIKVYVGEKLPEGTIPSAQRIPEAIELPDFSTALTTDVEPIGEQRLQLFTERRRPMVPGYSVGQLGLKSGTLGCVVAKVDDPLTPLILSNSHVLAQYGLAEKGTPIVQPGPDDGGSEGDTVAELLESVPFDFNPGFNNICDAAIAVATDRLNVDASIPYIGIPQTGTTASTIGMQVQKTGRTTGHTTGLIKDVNYRTLMSYPRPGGGWGTVGFRDQVLCERYTDGGDSGSLVCDMSGRALGLHWCGSTSTSVFSPIQYIFDLLRIKLWSGVP